MPENHVPENHVPDACPVCAVIRKTESGQGNTKAVKHIKNENAIWADVLSAQDKVADGITTFSGSMRFVYLHSVWFFVWVVLNVGLLGAGVEFDKFPFGLLTMIVSLEAIFLSTFVMICQNRQAARADLRAELDYETNLRSEIWSLHIGQALGIEPSHVEQIVAEAIANAMKTT